MSSVLRVTFPISLCAVVFLSITPCFAQNTIHVPADQPTIQGAIDVANNGDTVLVAPGTYFENINFKGKAITVTSSAGAAQTIIDGGAKGSVVIFHTGEGPSSVLNGFTLQNGAGYDPISGYAGGGINISSASPTITNNAVQHNTACEGPGVYVAFGSPLIQGNSITNNSPSLFSGCGGAGLWIGGTGTAQVIGNLIANNVTTSGNGGGIELWSAGAPVIRNNVITGNVATGLSPYTTGGGIDMTNASAPVIVQNLIYNNTAGQGSGINIGSPSATLVNNTIVGGPGGGEGTAVYACCGSFQLFNNVLVGSAGQSALYCGGTPTGETLLNNDVYSSNGATYGGNCAANVRSGNISADPLFANGASDFHLQPSSPVIDAGTNSAPNLPQTDFAGNPRILDGNNDCVSTIDMGAYELMRTASVNFSTNSLNFGSQVLNASSNPRAVTLSNTGSTCFQFSSLGITGDFSQTNTCGAAGLRGGSSCNFNLTFTPSALGARLGALTVSGSDGVTSASPIVSLSGVGADFSVMAAPTSASLKHGQSVKFTITVSPLGGAFGSTVAFSCSGLPSGASCGFSPSSVTPGDHGATSIMTVSTTGKTSRGNYNVLVFGKSGADVHSTTVLLSVN
jgi:parallel beta-helix repeat protein